MTRGIRGATTVTYNNEAQIVAATKLLLEEMIEKNEVEAENVSHMFISATKDIDAVFPSKFIREMPGWKHVPVMCMSEIDVQNSLSKCIRIMMVINAEKQQESIVHVFHNEAIQLRPDLIVEDR